MVRTGSTPIPYLVTTGFTQSNFKIGYNDYTTTATVFVGETTGVTGYLSEIPVIQPAAAVQPAYVQPVSPK